MFNYFKRIFLHPATHFNLLITGSLIVIGTLHNYAHYTMEIDSDSYVYQFCKKNKNKCKSYVGIYD